MATFNDKSLTSTGQNTKALNVIAAGEHTLATTDEDITINGLAATDIVVVGLHTQAGTTDIADLEGVCEADNLNIKATAVGDGAGIVSYIVVRP